MKRTFSWHTHLLIESGTAVTGAVGAATRSVSDIPAELQRLLACEPPPPPPPPSNDSERANTPPGCAYAGLIWRLGSSEPEGALPTPGAAPTLAPWLRSLEVLSG